MKCKFVKGIEMGTIWYIDCAVSGSIGCVWSDVERG